MRRILLSLSVVASLHADGMFDGFVDMAEDFAGVADAFKGVVHEVTKPKDEQPKLTLEGKVSAATTYNYNSEQATQNSNDLSGLSSLKLSADLNLEFKINKDHKLYGELKAYYDDIYNIRTSNYPNVPSTYKEMVEIGEAYIQGKINQNFDYKIGRQIVVWGNSDSLRVTDMLNPLDSRNPGITDIEDLRLPVGMVKLDWYFDEWQLGIIDIYEQRFTKMPQYGSGYINFDLPTINIPSYDQQFAVNLVGRFSSYDVSFYLADVFYDSYYLDITQSGSSYLKSLELSRVQMAGASTNIAIGGVLLKLETAFLNNVSFSDTLPPTVVSHGTKDVLKALIGFDYLITDGMISIEISDSHIFDYVSTLDSAPFNTKEDTISYTLRYNQSFINNKLGINFMAMLQGYQGENGGYQRGWISYDYSDDIDYEVGIVDYIGGESYLYEGMKHNDKIYVSGRYSF